MQFYKGYPACLQQVNMNSHAQSPIIARSQVGWVYMTLDNGASC